MEGPPSSRSRARRATSALLFYALPIVTWGGIALAAALWSIRDLRGHYVKMARDRASTIQEIVQTFRAWNAGQGGVYVPVTERTPPNPYLDTPDRDVATTGGLRLTKVNPAYMTHQVEGLARAHGDLGIRVTSLKPLNPANAPDAWERRALEDFARPGGGTGARVEIIEDARQGQRIRSIAPLLAEQACLTCHAKQGYRLGDVRGGLSLSIPAAEFLAQRRSHERTLAGVHALFFAAGAVGLGGFLRRIRRQWDALRQSKERYRALFSGGHDAVLVHGFGPDGALGPFVEVNDVACERLGYSREEFLGLTPADLNLPELRESIPARAARLHAQKHIVFETTHVAKDGRQIPVEISSALFELGGRDMVLAIARDLSERRRAEAVQRAVLRTAMDGFVIADAEGRILDVNDACSRLTGYHRDELVGMRIAALEAKESAAEIREHIRAITERGWDRFETRHRAKDGRELDVEVSVTHLDVGGASRLFAFMRDITEQKRAAAALAWDARVEAALGSLSRKFIASASLGDISSEILAAGHRLTGSRHGYLAHVERRPDAGAAEDDAVWKCKGSLLEADVISFKILSGMAHCLLRPPGPVVGGAPADVAVLALPAAHLPIERFVAAPAWLDDRLVGELVLANAPQGYAERDLKLAERLAGLFALAVLRWRTEQDLREAKDAAEAASRAKSQFLSVMSHELRTPLNSVIGFAQVLRRGHFGPLGDKQRGYVEDILQSGEHLLSLINDILDLSKIEAGKLSLEPRPLALGPVVARSLLFVRERALARRLALESTVPEGLAAALGDERAVLQVLVNLLANAVKFTPAGGRVTVRASADGDRIIVEVEDTGAGIAPEDQARVFEPFEQGSGSAARQAGGTGLGLSLVRSLVQAMGGGISLRSTPGQGSCFAFTLPLAPGSAGGDFAI